MKNIELMNLLELKYQDNTKRNTILVMGGIILIAGLGIFYLLEEDKKLKQMNAMISEKNDSLNFVINNQCARLIDQQIEIQDLQQKIQSLQKILAAATSAEKSSAA